MSVKAPDNSWPQVLATVIASIVMALYIWIPFFAYYTIDLISKRFGRPASAQTA